MSSNCSMDLQMIVDYINICKIVCREGYAVILNPELTGILNLVLLITRDLYQAGKPFVFKKLTEASF